MRAITMTAAGGPEVLVEATRPDPVPAAGELLVQVVPHRAPHAGRAFGRAEDSDRAGGEKGVEVSDAHEEVLVERPAAGPPQGRPAPSGGREPHEVGERGGHAT